MGGLLLSVILRYRQVPGIPRPAMRGSSGNLQDAAATSYKMLTREDGGPHDMIQKAAMLRIPRQNAAEGKNLCLRTLDDRWMLVACKPDSATPRVWPRMELQSTLPGCILGANTAESHSMDGLVYALCPDYR